MSEVGSSRLVTAPGNRVLSVWEGGDTGGTPVVFHHGTPSARLNAIPAAEPARRHGVRLIAFNRPGYGVSTNTPPSLASVGADTLVVADALGVDEFAVLGASGGGPYALATGLADQGRVRAVGLTAGVGPWRLIEPPDPENPDLPILALVDAGDIDGALQGFLAQGSVAFDRMLARDDEGLTDEFFADTPADDSDWLDPPTRRHWARDLRDALQTYDGYARDNVAWGGPWDIDPSQLRVPTWLWYGDRDVLVPLSHGHWLAQTIPRSTLVIRPGRGHGGTIVGYLDDVLVTLRDEVVRSRPPG